MVYKTVGELCPQSFLRSRGGEEMEPIIKKKTSERDNKFIPRKECWDCNFYLNKTLGCLIQIKMDDSSCFKR